MNNPFLDYPIKGESSNQAVTSTASLTVGQFLWFTTGVSFLLAIVGVLAYDELLIMVLVLDGETFWGASALLLVLGTFCALSPVLYFSRQWYLRSILLVQAFAVLVWIFVSVGLKIVYLVTM